MSHEMTMRLIVFGFVAGLFLVGFAMGVDGGGGRPAPGTPAKDPASDGVQPPSVASSDSHVSAGIASNAARPAPGLPSQG